MKILILIEHDNHILKASNFHTLTAAQQLGDEIDVFIIGYQCADVSAQAKTMPMIQHIYVADDQVYQYQLAENVSPLIAEYGKHYDVILTAANSYGKNILPRVAALLDMAMVADVIKIVSTDTFIRPIYAGNALSTVMNSEQIKILTVRTTAFPATAAVENSRASQMMVQSSISNELSVLVKQELTAALRPELSNARIIIAGGRGLKSAENFKQLEELADRIGAAVGASRAAVDAGFAPNDYQIGQTGKVVAPDLYLAIGISGAIQHVAGMKESKVIVAINSDPDAPIFQIADYGLVGDLFELLPELQAEWDRSMTS